MPEDGPHAGSFAVMPIACAPLLDGGAMIATPGSAPSWRTPIRQAAAPLNASAGGLGARG
jgi:hypothetical protein